MFPKMWDQLPCMNIAVKMVIQLWLGGNIRGNGGPLKNECFAAFEFLSENHKIDDDDGYRDDGKTQGPARRVC